MVLVMLPSTSAPQPSGSSFIWNKGLPDPMSGLSPPPPHCVPRATQPRPQLWPSTYLDSSPVASTPKNSHTAGQNCSLHVMKSSSKLERGEGEPG